MSYSVHARDVAEVANNLKGMRYCSKGNPSVAVMVGTYVYGGALKKTASSVRFGKACSRREISIDYVIQTLERQLRQLPLLDSSIGLRRLRLFACWVLWSRREQSQSLPDEHFHGGV